MHVIENGVAGDLIDVSSTESAVSVSKQSVRAMKSFHRRAYHKNRTCVRSLDTQLISKTYDQIASFSA